MRKDMRHLTGGTYTHRNIKKNHTEPLAKIQGYQTVYLVAPFLLWTSVDCEFILALVSMKGSSTIIYFR